MNGTLTLARRIAHFRKILLTVIPMLALSLASPAFADKERSKEYLEDALEWLQKGDGQAALIQLRNAIKEDPENYQARLLLGRLYLEIGNVPAGRKELELAHAASPSDESEMFLGRAQLEVPSKCPKRV